MKNVSVCVLVSWLGVCCQARGQSDVITTVAGNGTYGFSGDGGAATSAELNLPFAVTVDASRNLFITDTYNQRIRKVSAGGIITTVAGNAAGASLFNGGFSGDGGPATLAELNLPSGVAVDASGNLFIADSSNNRIRKVSISGIITTFAGNGSKGFSGDGGRATSAELNLPGPEGQGIAVDAFGNLFIADTGNNRIRKVSPSGMIMTIAGDGTAGFSGDDGSATSASLNQPFGIAVDASGNLFIADTFNQRIRKVSPSGIITTIAGSAGTGFDGDGGPATSASLLLPCSVAVDASGDILIVDSNRVRQVSASGIITTVAGNGIAGFSDDGGPATSAELSHPLGVAVDAFGSLFIADTNNDRIREVLAQAPSLTALPVSISLSLIRGAASSQQISLTSPAAGLAWSASASASWITLSPSSGTAPSALTVAIDTASLQPGAYTATITISNPLASPPQETLSVNLTVTPATATISVAPAALNFQIEQGSTSQLQSLRISGTADTMWWATVATTTGGAWLSVSPASGQIPATLTAQVNWGILLTPGTYQGSINIQAPAMPPSRTINITLTVTAGGGIITTVAGSGGIGYYNGGFSGDGGPAAAAVLNNPDNVAVDSLGNVFIADTFNDRIRKLSASGIITTVAGSGKLGYSGDGGPAISAELNFPLAVTVDAFGNLFIPDTGNNRIRKVSANGNISAVAGNGTAGFSGEGGPATSAALNSPKDVAVDALGNLFIADHDNNRIRKVSVNGIITTFAGNGTNDYAGDGGAATSAALPGPRAIAEDTSGNLFIVGDDSRIRKVSASGIITTVVNIYGANVPVIDGGPAITAPLFYPQGIAIDRSGDLVIADTLNNRIRKVSSADGTITTVAGSGGSGGESQGAFSGDGGLATSALLSNPVGVGVDASGNIFIADSGNQRIRKVSASASAAAISVSTPNLQFSYTLGGALPAAQTITITNPGGGSLSWSATADVSWITLSETSSSLMVAINQAGLSVGANSGTITITAAGATSRPVVIPVKVTVSESGAPVVSSATHFVPVTPCRIADTRNPNGAFGGPAIAGNTSRDFEIPNSACGIPSTAAAYSLNVAVVPKVTLGYLTVWPASQPQPVVATMTSLDGRIKSNAAIIAAGVSGAISVYVTDDTDVILDVNGYFTSAVTAGASAFYPLTPCRIADTRNAADPLGGPGLLAGSTRSFPIPESTCGVPTIATAYSMNFAAVPKGPLGYLTAWPAGQPQPVVASLNAVTGAITANAVIVPAGSDGAVDVYTTNDTDLVIDINGYFAAPGPGGLSLYAMTPCRVLDSRLPAGTPPFNAAMDVDVTTSTCGAPATARAFVFNATVVPPGPVGFLTMWPEGEPQPLAATLNALDGGITSNMAIVPTTNGSITAYPSNPTYLILDIFGFFAP